MTFQTNGLGSVIPMSAVMSGVGMVVVGAKATASTEANPLSNATIWVSVIARKLAESTNLVRASPVTAHTNGKWSMVTVVSDGTGITVVGTNADGVRVCPVLTAGTGMVVVGARATAETLVVVSSVTTWVSVIARSASSSTNRRRASPVTAHTNGRRSATATAPVSTVGVGIVVVGARAVAVAVDQH